MIKRLHVLHSLTEDAHDCVAAALGAAESGSRRRSLRYDDSPVKEIQLFRASDEYFMRAVIDFPLFGCSYEEFPAVLYRTYTDMMGDAAGLLGNYESLAVDYIEYADSIRYDGRDKCDAAFAALRERCAPQQLDRGLWSEYKKPGGTVGFYAARDDETHIGLLVSANGTVLKKRIKDSALHRGRGVAAAAAVDAGTERGIIAWCMSMHRLKPQTEGCLPEIISSLPQEQASVARMFLTLAEKLGLRAAVRFAAPSGKWKCAFSLPKPKRVLFTLECGAGRFTIKSNLFHIDSYLSGTDGITDAIAGSLRAAWKCGECNPACRRGQGVYLTLDGKTERKCKGGAFIFENLSAEEWRTVLNMTETEAAIK